jgi:hypothetical protein
MRKGISRLGMALAIVTSALAAFGCSGTAHPTAQPVQVAITNKMSTVAAGAAVTFNATVTNDAADEGVTWTIAPTTGGGAISSTTTTSVLYTAPATPPTTNSVTITATSVADTTKSDSVTFTIGAKAAAISVSITNKVASLTAGAATVTLNATVSNDSANAGVNWMLTAGGAACSPTCGTIGQAMAASVVYTPPATAPAAPNNTPTITATSITDKTKSDTDAITIQAAAAIKVAITNKISTVAPGAAAVTLNASVTNDGANAGVNWTLTAGGAACSPTCGTIGQATAASVVYTPPATAPAAPNNAPTITATSVTDKTKSDTDAITIQAAATGITVAITNKFKTITAGGPTVTVNVAVTNDPKNDGVTWTLTAGGTDCQPTCGTLTLNAQFTVMYTSPTNAPGAPNNTPTLTATSFTDGKTSDSFMFTIAPPAASLSLLKGQYAAVLQGSNSKLAPRAMALSFTADGSGRITQASVDVNDDFHVYDIDSAGATLGTYTVDTSLNNTVRGVITLPSYTIPDYPGSATSPSLGFVFVLTADGKSGNLEERDQSLAVVSGKLYQQDPTAFSLAIAGGDYAFGAGTAFNGNVASNNNWQAMVGHILVSGDDGSFQIGLVDMSEAQTGPTLTNAKLAGGISAPDTNGRGTMNMIPTGAAATSYVYYVVSASKMVFVEFDTASTGVNTIFAGTATRQKTPFSTSTLNGASVFWANGQENVNVMGSSAAGGRLVFSKSTSASVEFDRTYNSSGHPANNTGTGLTVALDITTGRGTVTFANGASNLLFDSAVLYMYDANSGYLLDTTKSTLAEALFGQFLPQAAGPFDSTYLSGNLLTLEGGYESRAAAQFFGVMTIASPSGAYSFFDYYQDSSGNIQTGTISGDPQAVLGNIEATSGRGTGNFDPSGNQCSNDAVCGSAFYLIGKNQAVMVNQPKAAPATQEDSSTVFLDPQ